MFGQSTATSISGVSGGVRTNEGCDPKRTDLLSGILGCRSFDEVLDNISEPLAADIDASHFMFFRYELLSKNEGFISERFFRQSDSDVHNAYCNRFYAVDPLLTPYMEWLIEGPRSNVGARIQNLDDIPRGYTADFRRFLHSHELGHNAGIGIPVLMGDVPQVFCLGFQRAPDERPFTERDTERLLRFLPAIRCVIEGIAAREAYDLSNTVLEAVTQTSDGCGYVVLDGDLMIRSANPLGLQHLGLGNGRSDLWARNSDLLGAVREYIMEAGQELQPDCGPIKLCVEETPSGPMNIEIQQVMPTMREPQWLLITRRNCNNRRLALLSDCYGLSAREAEVVHLLGTGESNSDIGRVLGIARRTVENHLRSIYAKCGVHTRAQMISKLIES